MGDVLFGGAAGAAADVAGAMINQQNVRETNATNVQLARENTAFQERMSSTAYQRAAKDMKKAGLNPILAGMNQSGSSTPSGSVARVESPQTGDVFKSLGRNLTNTARERARYEKEMANLDADTAKKGAETLQQVQMTKTQTHATQLAALEVKIKKGEIKPAQAKQEYEALQTKWDTDAIEWDNWMKRIGEGVGIIGNGIGQGIKGIFKPKPGGPPDGKTLHKQLKQYQRSKGLIK